MHEVTQGSAEANGSLPSDAFVMTDPCLAGEGLDYKAMASIFSGLSQCGAWGCFDEFNRIEAEVLSVVSSQIRQIQEALKTSQTRFTFEGEAT